MVASDYDGLWFNLKAKKELNINDLFRAEQIKAISYDREDEEFYVIFNYKKTGGVGLFLVKFEAQCPYHHGFLCRW